jgi:hypothetical protein
VAKGWILLTETGDKKGRNVAVRVSSIDAICPRKSYSTLYVHGTFMHVDETFDVLVKMIEGDEGV